ncbi:MAG: hypothetical protein FWF70_05295 [Bacteroidetes bacterium]|nr:hypothetical protein [Bacteroidota bacterium]MCL1969381.1 hypothetical protein [Bacteroidota bacterium]
MNKRIISVLVAFLFTSLWAQEVPIGQFKEYLSYNKFRWIAQDSENIYAATDNSILVIDKTDGSKSKWSNLNGLSEVGIQTIHSDPEGRVIIAYKNSDIDVIKDYKVYNVRDILNKQLTGSKTINNITTFGSLAYFACDFGVVILDLKTLLVKDSWFTIKNNESYSARFLTIHKERYYLATDKGVFSLPADASNPADFSLWTAENELSQSLYKLLCSYQDKLYAVKYGGAAADSLFVYENEQWSRDTLIGMSYYRSFDIKDDKLLVCSWDHIRIFSGDTMIQWFYWKQLQNEWQNGCQALFDKEMNVWVADNALGVLHIDLRRKTYEPITAEGPANSSAYGLCFFDGALAVVPGARDNAIVPVYSQPAISILKDDLWRSNTDFSKSGSDRPYGFNSVAINPLNTNEIYIASWIDGLFKINMLTNKTFCYNNHNSILKSSRKDSIVFLSGLVIDKKNNLWMAQTDVFDFIKVKDLKSEEEKWYSFNMSPYITSSVELYAEHILIDSRNYKWFTIPISSGTPSQKLLVFSEGESLDNEASHKKAEVDITSQVDVSGSRITCIAEDREGRIWVGADQGIKVIYDAASVFNRKIYAKNIYIKQPIGDTAYVQILFEFEYITCIAVDAADRKWIGTRNAGVFLISPNGMEELFHFTTDNSPLFSNQINDIKINPENGEVFFATAGGLISYKGTATAGKENYKEVIVYPNPVREDYYGPVAVKGLMEDSFCKITDASGRLVWQGYAYGGQLIWNGKDFYGNRPATGVYFVMASSKTGKEKKVAKFLFIQ